MLPHSVSLILTQYPREYILPVIPLLFKGLNVFICIGEDDIISELKVSF